MHLSSVLASFLVGALIGLTSMGGAALMAPFLILVIGLPPITAVGTDLAYGAATKLVASWVHVKQGTVDVPLVKQLAVGSVPGGLAGSLLVFLLPRFTHDAQRYVQQFIGLLLIVVAVVLTAQLLIHSPVLSARRAAFLRGRGTVFWGALVGFCVGATSVGSGSLLAPFLMLLYPSETAKVVGTDVCHAAILVSVAGLTHVGSGGVEWALLPTLLAGSIPGVLIGSRLAFYVPARPLRTALAGLLLATGYHML
jgi:uncharacterized membrane protein YfcA